MWSADSDWPEIEAPTSAFNGLVSRAWWVAKALINSNPETDHIKAQLDWSPEPSCAPRLRSFCFALFLFRRFRRSSGESVDGGKCELVEFCPSLALSSATCFIRDATCCSS